jgi:hypothetical protein
VDSTSLTKKLDDLSKKLLMEQQTANLSMNAKSDLMSSRLNNSCQDAIEKFTTMANQGMKIKDAQMRQWANFMLTPTAPKEMEDIDSGSSIYSENFEFRFEGLKKQRSKEEDNCNDGGSSVMSMIENFEKL